MLQLQLQINKLIARPFRLPQHRYIEKSECFVNRNNFLPPFLLCRSKILKKKKNIITNVKIGFELNYLSSSNDTSSNSQHLSFQIDLLPDHHYLCSKIPADLQNPHTEVNLTATNMVARCQLQQVYPL